MTQEKDSKKPSVFKEEGQEADAYETDEESASDKNEKTSLGLEPNIAGLLCYLFGFISGLILFLLEKENSFVRFHAMQSIVMSVAIFLFVFIIGLIPFVGWVIGLLVAPFSFVLWIFMMYKAYQEEWYKLPWIGDFAEQQMNKMQ